MSVQTTLEIAASPVRVWTLLDNPDCLPLWMPDIIETQYPQGRPANGGRGVIFRQIVNQNGGPKAYDGEVIAFEAGRHLGVRLTDGSVIIDAYYTVEAGGPGTVLTFNGDVRMQNPLMNMMMVAAWPMTRTLMLDQINRLKAAAEQPPLETARQKATAKPAARPASKAKTKAKTKAVVKARPNTSRPASKPSAKRPSPAPAKAAKKRK